MSITLVQLAPMIAATTTVGGLIFQIGKHSEKLDMIGFPQPIMLMINLKQY